MTKRKGQTELMGLAVVIVLIIFALLFTLKFFVGKGDDEGRKGFIQSELSANFMATLFKTTSECKRMSFTELYKDCAANAGSITCESGDSCEYINYHTSDLLNKTLKRFGKTFRYNASVDDTAIVEIKPVGKCKNWRSNLYGIPLNPGRIIVRLDVCE